MESAPVLRKTDISPAYCLRSNRFFKEGGYWHYLTREKIQLGPYKSLLQAQEGLSAYLRYLGVETA